MAVAIMASGAAARARAGSGSTDEEEQKEAVAGYDMPRVRHDRARDRVQQQPIDVRPETHVIRRKENRKLYSAAFSPDVCPRGAPTIVATLLYFHAHKWS
jgi:hypothetical protein